MSAENTMNETEETHPTDQKRLINELVKIPVINSSVETLSSVYNKSKEFSSIIKVPCDIAEKSVKVALSVASPITNSAPVQQVDSFACSKLEKLEGYFPSIMTPTETIIKEVQDKGQGIISRTWEPAVNAASGVKNFTWSKCKALKDLGMSAFSSLQETINPESAEPSSTDEKKEMSPNMKLAADNLRKFLKSDFKSGVKNIDIGREQIENILKHSGTLKSLLDDLDSALKIFKDSKLSAHIRRISDMALTAALSEEAKNDFDNTSDHKRRYMILMHHISKRLLEELHGVHNLLNQNLPEPFMNGYKHALSLTEGVFNDLRQRELSAPVIRVVEDSVSNVRGYIMMWHNWANSELSSEHPETTEHSEQHHSENR